MGLDRNFWNGKRVLITGHTGFKGSWMSFWLSELGANLKGIAHLPATDPNLYSVLKLDQRMESIVGDIRDLEFVKDEITRFQPDIIIHMAAQAIVRTSYEEPVETFQTNVIGTANLLEAVRNSKNLKAFISVTSDKCYENNEWPWKYRETDAMGGWDPYSASKGCAELVTASYRRSFFQNKQDADSVPGIASARAGNVIGGGDWSRDRLIPDIMRAFSKNEEVIIRNPVSVRPWQYILDLLNGYLMLAEKLAVDNSYFSGAWNFGPAENDEKSVEYIMKQMIGIWGDDATWKLDKAKNPHEANYLKLDSSKARMKLNWQSRMTLDESLHELTTWYKNYYEGKDMIEVTRQQITNFENK